MTSPSEPRTPRLYHAGAGSALPPNVALGVLFAGVASMLVIGVVGQQARLPLLVTLVLASVTMLAIPVVAMIRLDERRTALGLRWPDRRLLIAAALIGTTAWYLNVRLVSLLPFEGGQLRSLDRVVTEPPLIIVLLAIAVVPAICEEVLFRGAVQRSLATRLFPIGAVVLTSLLFAGYHMSLVQLIPTFTLALALGALAHRADSVVPAMLAHFLNNAMAILVARRQPEGLAGALDAHPTLALAGCAAATVIGLALIAKGPA